MGAFQTTRPADKKRGYPGHLTRRTKMHVALKAAFSHSRVKRLGTLVLRVDGFLQLVGVPVLFGVGVRRRLVLFTRHGRRQPLGVGVRVLGRSEDLRIGSNG